MSEHLGELNSAFRSRNWVAKCSCGWSGPERWSSDTAEADLREHYREAPAASPASASGVGPQADTPKERLTYAAVGSIDFPPEEAPATEKQEGRPCNHGGVTGEANCELPAGHKGYHQAGTYCWQNTADNSPGGMPPGVRYSTAPATEEAALSEPGDFAESRHANTAVESRSDTPSPGSLSAGPGTLPDEAETIREALDRRGASSPQYARRAHAALNRLVARAEAAERQELLADRRTAAAVARAEEAERRVRELEAQLEAQSPEKPGDVRGGEA